MAWDFDGIDQYVRFAMPAALQTAAGGPMTMAALVHLDATTDGAFIHTMSGATSFQFLEVFGSYNYGTTIGARNGPAATAGAWFIVIVSKDTGNVAPEITVIPLATGVPVSGSMTGGGVTLGDGTAPGAAGFIQAARWGTSATEYVNGRIAAAAIFTAFKAQAAREAMTTWALWLAAAGIRWGVRFNTLATLTDASGNGGGETARFGTAAMTLAADPSGLAIDFFAAGGAPVAIADGSGGAGSSGAAEGLVLGDGSLSSGTGGAGDGLALGDVPGGSGTVGAVDGLQLGDGSSGPGSAGGPDGIQLGDLPGGGGTTGGVDGLTLGDASAAGGTGGTVDLPPVGPVTIMDASGGVGSGGHPNAPTSSQVVHDTMVMPILLNTRACLVTQVGKLAFPPARVQIRPGASFEFQVDQFVNECCDGIAWVRRGVLTPTGSNWPNPLSEASKNRPGFYAVTLEIGIERCLPIASNAEGAIVTAAQWEQAAINAEDDGAALRRVVCCLRDLYGNDSIIENPSIPLENAGMCGGQVLTLLVRAPACDCVG